MTTDWAVKWQQERNEAAAKGKAYLLALIPTFKAAGVTKVLAHYDGQGDEGQIESVHVIVGENEPVDLESLPGLADTEKLMDAVYHVLEKEHSGWEINEGSFGDVVLHVETGKIVIEHNERVESSIYSEGEV